jgi:ribA/ribD-fused uncharacterized protein
MVRSIKNKNMKYSTNWLNEKIANGFQANYLFFWGHTQKQENIIDKSCFSQWYPSAFVVDGTTYLTAEHWMMAKKALLFNDTETFKKILETTTPNIAKKLGREVKNFDSAIWEAHAYEFVVEGNFHKFSQHEGLKNYLLSTEDNIIVEASPVDFIWGIGLSQDDNDAYNPLKWKGGNLLGFALMEVRDRLKNA